MKSQALRVGIVGGGFAGLAAAVELVRSVKNDGIELEISIFEKASQLGGRASTAEKDGYQLNQGAHALYKGAAGFRLLNEMSIEAKGNPPKSDSAVTILDGKKYELPRSLPAMARTELFSISEKMELGIIMGEITTSDPSSFMGTKYGDWVKSKTSSVRVSEFLHALARLGSYANDTNNLSAGVSIRQMKISITEGVLYLHGGWQQIVEALREKALSPKTSFLHEEVKRVKQGESGTVILGTATSEYEFDRVVFALPYKAAEKLVPNLVDDTTKRKLMPAKIACLDLCLKKLPNEHITFSLGFETPLYYSVHSAAADLAPKGAALVCLGYYLNSDEQGNEKHEDAMLSLMDQLQDGWRSELVYKRFLPNMVASSTISTAALNGSNGISAPEAHNSDLKNILFCGDWVGEKDILADASLASGTTAARIIVEAAKKALAFSQ